MLVSPASGYAKLGIPLPFFAPLPTTTGGLVRFGEAVQAERRVVAALQRLTMGTRGHLAWLLQHRDQNRLAAPADQSMPCSEYDNLINCLPYLLPRCYPEA